MRNHTKEAVMRDGRREKCPVAATVDVIGGKWKPIIIHYLLEGTRRFGELRRLMPEVTQQMLTLQLRELERDGVVHREVYRQVPPKTEYSLTPLGRSLEPVMRLMLEWGESYVERGSGSGETHAPPETDGVGGRRPEGSTRAAPAPHRL
jgi:DNA-binding HxlR family transcriptional regulator